jgi:hypothetical protein
MVFPLNVGTFFTSLVEISRNDSAVCRIVLISEAVRILIPRRCLCLKADKLLLLLQSCRLCYEDFIGVIDLFEFDLNLLPF